MKDESHSSIARQLSSHSCCILHELALCASIDCFGRIMQGCLPTNIRAQARWLQPMCAGHLSYHPMILCCLLNSECISLGRPHTKQYKTNRPAVHLYHLNAWAEHIPTSMKMIEWDAKYQGGLQCKAHASLTSPADLKMSQTLSLTLMLISELPSSERTFLFA